MSFTGRGSELLYQAGGTAKRRLQEGEREGQHKILRDGFCHFSERVHGCHVSASTWGKISQLVSVTCFWNNILHSSWPAVMSVTDLDRCLLSEFWRTLTLASVRAVTVVRSPRVLSSAASFTHTIGLSPTPLIHKMSTGKTTFKSHILYCTPKIVQRNK